MRCANITGRNPRHVPGGALIDEGIYWVDLFRWLAKSDVVLVEAKTANLVHKDIAVEDWGMATFTFADGLIATLEASWTITAPRKTGPSPKQNSVVRLEIVGTVAKLRLKPPSDTAGADGESSLLGGLFAAATKTASEAERTKNLLHLQRHRL